MAKTKREVFKKVEYLKNDLRGLVKYGTQVPDEFPVITKDIAGNYEFVYSKYHYYNCQAISWFKVSDVFDSFEPVELV